MTSLSQQSKSLEVMMTERLQTLPALLLLAVLVLLGTQATQADEVRPAYLGLEERGDQSYSIVWKLPVKDGLVRDVMPVFPEVCSMDMQPFAELTGDAKVLRGSLSCAGQGLEIGHVSVPGLQTSLMETLIHVKWASGDTHHHILKPGESVALQKHKSPIVNDYLYLGFEHILGGTDHLLFVLALLLIVSGSMAILKAVTAFTLGHSITLALASLDVISLPSAPVEALIALSIAFLCVEALAMRRGRETLTTRAPWIVAILFGLLHGLGFAGALKDVGFPDDDIPLALLFFNLGIEAGQLAFVAVVLTALAVMQFVWSKVLPETGNKELSEYVAAPAYAIGAVGMFWALERIAGMVA